MNDFSKISKILSSNDVGETGSHQTGILVPKQQEIFKFFPPLPNRTKNPRVSIKVVDHEGCIWNFKFTYYNNLFFGGTRNEYHLTRMVPYFKKHKLKEGDEITLEKDLHSTGNYDINFVRHSKSESNKPVKLTLGSHWKTVKI